MLDTRPRQIEHASGTHAGVRPSGRFIIASIINQLRQSFGNRLATPKSSERRARGPFEILLVRGYGVALSLDTRFLAPAAVTGASDLKLFCKSLPGANVLALVQADDIVFPRISSRWIGLCRSRLGLVPNAALRPTGQSPTFIITLL